MKTLYRCGLPLSGVVAAFIVAPIANAQNAVPSTSIAPLNVSSSTKTAPAKTYNRALDADLVAAVKSDDTAKVRDLLSRNADPKVKDSSVSVEPILVTAVLKGNVDIVRALIEAGADVHATTVQGNSPLSMAALKGRVEISKYLLQRGAQVEGANPGGPTPLMLAARSGETDIVRALIAAGANVNGRTSIVNGNLTPLHYACEDSSFGIVKLEIVKMLVEAGADVSLKNGAGKTAVEVAILGKGKARNNIVFTELSNIEKYLISIYKRDGALFMAIGKLYVENAKLDSSTRAADWQAVKDAVAGGATARFTDDASGGTTLIFLAYGLRDADDATMQTLVARSYLNAQEKQYGFSALHMAVTNNNLKMVGGLIKAGANLNLLSADRKTPLDLMLKETLVVKPDHQNIISLLKNAGAKTYAELQKPGTSTSSTRTPAATPKTTTTPAPKPDTPKINATKTVAFVKLLQKTFDLVAATKLV